MTYPFNIGDKVVCVDARNPTFGDVPMVKEGRTYVVSGFREHPKGLGVFLIGIEAVKDGQRIAYLTWRFRKLTDIQQENRIRRTKTAVTPVDSMYP